MASTTRVLTPEQQELVLKWMEYAYAVGYEAGLRFRYPTEDARGLAALALCRVVSRGHTTINSEYLRRSIVGAILKQLMFGKKVKKCRPQLKGYTAPVQAPELDSETRLDGRLLWDACQKYLPARLYRILEARYREGQTLEEISAELGQTKQSVHYLHHQAVLKMQNILCIPAVGALGPPISGKMPAPHV